MTDQPLPQCNVPRDAGNETFFCWKPKGHEGDHAQYPMIRDVQWTGEWKEHEPAGPED